jgi:hypothetical protein
VYRVVLMPDGNWWTIDNFKYASALSLPPNGHSNNVAKYGRLYSSADAVASAPASCHLPSGDEYCTLFKFTGINEYDLQYVTRSGNVDTPIPGYVGRIFHGITNQLLRRDVVAPDDAGRRTAEYGADGDYDPLLFDLVPAGYGDGAGNYNDFGNDYANYILPTLMASDGFWSQYWNVSDLSLQYLPYLTGWITRAVWGSVRYIVDASAVVPGVDPTNYTRHTLSQMVVKDTSGRGVSFMHMMRNNYRSAIVKHY